MHKSLILLLIGALAILGVGWWEWSTQQKFITISDFISGAGSAINPQIFGGPNSVIKQYPSEQHDLSYYVKSFAPAAITIALLPTCIFMIFSSRFKPADRHWAYGIIGLLIGFWLKQPMT